MKDLTYKESRQLDHHMGTLLTLIHVACIHVPIVKMERMFSSYLSREDLHKIIKTVNADNRALSNDELYTNAEDIHTFVTEFYSCFSLGEIEAKQKAIEEEYVELAKKKWVDDGDKPFNEMNMEEASEALVKIESFRVNNFELSEEPSLHESLTTAIVDRMEEIKPFDERQVG